MATTRLIPHHISSGRTIAESMQDRFDYGKDPAKTLDGALIRSYECDPMTADAEFLLTKAMYKAITGREQDRDADVLCYQIRQSFPPGELDPKAALDIGYELAMRWTKGRHAFSWCPMWTVRIPMCISTTTPPRWTAPEIPQFLLFQFRPAAALRTGYAWA